MDETIPDVMLYHGEVNATVRKILRLSADSRWIEFPLTGVEKNELASDSVKPK